MKTKIALITMTLVAFICGNSAYAAENTAIGEKLNNKVCDSVTNDVMKELLKQTIYSVGTQVLNKINQNNTVTAPVYTTPVYTTPVTTSTPVYTAPAATPVTTTTSTPQEQMIIIQ